MFTRRRLRWLLWVLPGLLAGTWLGTACRIVWFGTQESIGTADVAIVLGAAAWGNKPSPVYRERIAQALLLYHQGRVRWIIFTGGTREPGFPSEAEVGLQFALSKDVPARFMLVDSASHTTWQNLEQAKALMDTAQLHTALLVSDPLHMQRASAMAHDLGLIAEPAPTLSSRFHSLATRGKFLWRETWLYLAYRLLGPRWLE